MAKKVIFKFRDGEREVRAGDTVYLENVNKWHTETKIKTIGRTLIHLESGNAFYFTGAERSDYCYNQAWSSRDACEKHQEKEKIFVEVRILLGFHSSMDKVPMDLLIKLRELLSEQKRTTCKN